METRTHLRLKRLGVAFLVREGCLAAATEVACPIHRYRLDAAGYRDVRARRTGGVSEGAEALLWNGATASNERRPVEPRTIAIECKQSRADFHRDRRDLSRLRALQAQIERRLDRLEQTRIREEEPHLRRSETSLFPGEESWDFHRSSLPAYQHSLKRLAFIETKMYGETKFLTIARYRLADYLFVLAPRGLLRPSEIPCEWGLLECDQHALRAEQLNLDPSEALPLRIRKPAPQLTTNDRRRQRLLRNIAVAATRAAARGLCAADDETSASRTASGGLNSELG